MGIISDVKCGKCDRRYSGLRGRCPYCGARRGKRGKHSNDVDNSSGKLIIGLLLALVLVVAVVILIITSANKDKTKNDSQPAEEQQETNNAADEDITGAEGTTGNGTGTGADATDKTDGTTAGDTTTDGTAVGDTPTDTTDGDTAAEPDDTDDNSGTSAETGAVTAVDIMWNNGVLSDFTANVGQVLNMEYATTPADSGKSVKWSSSDESVFTVLQTGELTVVGSGKATLTLTVDGVTAECIVRVN